MATGESVTLSAQKRTRLSERAYVLVRERILKGQVPLGAIMSRRKLAAELGMSPLPIAEALQRLENEGLLESRPRVGTCVRQPTAQDIRERYEVREALESQAARLFAERATAQQRLELKTMAERMDELFNRCSPDSNDDPEFLHAVHSYHAELHSRIAASTGCTALRQAIDRNHVLIFNWLFDVAARRPPLPPRFHRDLIEAISKPNPEPADRAMRQHIRYGLDSILRALTAAPATPNGRPRRSQKP